MTAPDPESCFPSVVVKDFSRDFLMMRAREFMASRFGAPNAALDPDRWHERYG